MEARNCTTVMRTNCKKHVKNMLSANSACSGSCTELPMEADSGCVKVCSEKVFYKIQGKQPGTDAYGACAFTTASMQSGNNSCSCSSSNTNPADLQPMIRDALTCNLRRV